MKKRDEIPVCDTWNLADILPSDEAWEALFLETERELAGYKEFEGHLAESGEVLFQCLKFDEDISLGEDTLFFARAVKQCPQILILTERFYNYVKYSESAAHGAMNEKKMTNLLAWNRIEKIYEDNSRILRTVRGAYGRQCAFFLRRMCSSGDRTEPYYGICREGVLNNFWDMMADKSVKHRIFYLGMLLAPKLYCRLKG